MPQRLRTFGGGLALIAMAALALRLAFTLAVAPDVRTLPPSDAGAYHLLANNLAAVAERRCFHRATREAGPTISSRWPQYAGLCPSTEQVQNLPSDEAPGGEPGAFVASGPAHLRHAGLCAR